MVVKKEEPSEINKMDHRGQDHMITKHFIGGYIIEESPYPFITPAQSELRKLKDHKPIPKVENGDSIPCQRSNSGRRPNQRKTKPYSTSERKPKQKRRMTISNRSHNQKLFACRRTSFHGHETPGSGNAEKQYSAFETSSRVENISSDEKVETVMEAVEARVAVENKLTSVEKEMQVEPPVSNEVPMEDEERIEPVVAEKATESCQVKKSMETSNQKTNLSKLNISHDDQNIAEFIKSEKDSDFSESNESDFSAIDDGAGGRSDFSDASNQPSALVYGGKCISKWSPDEVFQYLKSIPCLSRFAQDLKSQDIDGESMQLLAFEHLIGMNIPFGSVLKLLNLIKKLTK